MMSSSIYESFFDTSPIAYLIFRSDGKIKHANNTACSLFGYSKTEIQLYQQDTIFNSSDNLFSSWVRQQKDSGYFKGMINGKSKDGNTFPLQIFSNII